MNKKRLKVFIAGFSMWLSLPFFIQAQETFVLSTGPEGNCIIQYTAPVVREAYSRIGIDIEFLNLPWPRALECSNTGLTDGELFRTDIINKETYPGLIRVSPQIGHIEFLVFSKKPDIQISDWQSLRPYHIVYARGVEYIRNKTEGMNVYTVKDLHQAMRMLHSDRCDIVIADRLAGIKAIQEDGLDGIYIIDPPVDRIPVYHFVNVKHKELLPELEKNIKALSEEGLIELIYEQVIQKLTIPQPVE